MEGRRTSFQPNGGSRSGNSHSDPRYYKEYVGVISNLRGTYGFIQPLGGGRQVYFNVRSAFDVNLKVFDEVIYVLIPGDKGDMGNKVRKINPDIKEFVYPIFGVVSQEHNNLDFSPGRIILGSDEKNPNIPFSNRPVNNEIPYFRIDVEPNSPALTIGDEVSFLLYYIPKTGYFRASSIKFSRSKRQIFACEQYERMKAAGNPRERGIIVKWKENEYGFIESLGHSEDIFFRDSDIIDPSIRIEEGSEVEFFVLSEFSKGKFVDRAVFLTHLPKGTVVTSCPVASSCLCTVTALPSSDNHEASVCFFNPITLSSTDLIGLNQGCNELKWAKLVLSPMKTGNAWSIGAHSPTVTSSRTRHRRVQIGDVISIKVDYSFRRGGFFGQFLEWVHLSSIQGDVGVIESLHSGPSGSYQYGFLRPYARDDAKIYFSTSDILEPLSPHNRAHILRVGALVRFDTLGSPDQVLDHHDMKRSNEKEYPKLRADRVEVLDEAQMEAFCPSSMALDSLNSIVWQPKSIYDIKEYQNRASASEGTSSINSDPRFLLLATQVVGKIPPMKITTNLNHLQILSCPNLVFPVSSNAIKVNNAMTFIYPEIWQFFLDFRRCSQYFGISQICLPMLTSAQRRAYHLVAAYFPEISHETIEVTSCSTENGASSSTYNNNLRDIVLSINPRQSSIEDDFKFDFVTMTDLPESLALISFLRDDFNEKFGPLAPHIKVNFDLYLDKRSLKLVAKQVCLTDSSLVWNASVMKKRLATNCFGSDKDSLTYFGVIDSVIHQQFGFLRTIPSGDKIFWHRNFLAPSFLESHSELFDLVGHSVVFQLRNRGGLLCAIEITSSTQFLSSPPQALALSQWPFFQANHRLSFCCLGLVLDSTSIIVWKFLAEDGKPQPIENPDALLASHYFSFPEPCLTAALSASDDIKDETEEFQAFNSFPFYARRPIRLLPSSFRYSSSIAMSPVGESIGKDLSTSISSTPSTTSTVPTATSTTITPTATLPQEVSASSLSVPSASCSTSSIISNVATASVAAAGGAAASVSSSTAPKISNLWEVSCGSGDIVRVAPIVSYSNSPFPHSAILSHRLEGLKGVCVEGHLRTRRPAKHCCWKSPEVNRLMDLTSTSSCGVLVNGNCEDFLLEIQYSDPETSITCWAYCLHQDLYGEKEKVEFGALVKFWIVMDRERYHLQHPVLALDPHIEKPTPGSVKTVSSNLMMSNGKNMTSLNSAPKITSIHSEDTIVMANGPPSDTSRGFEAGWREPHNISELPWKYLFFGQ